MDCKKVNINSVSQGTRVLSLKDCRKIVKFSSDVFRLYHVYEIKTSGSAPKQTNKQKDHPLLCNIENIVIFQIMPDAEFEKVVISCKESEFIYYVDKKINLLINSCTYICTKVIPNTNIEKAVIS